ncbi:MAG: hypothetical protein IPO05_16015 [Flavobacteriales bacterium]|nr:hypothetical protein [Flavobacteriales bacterium]
MHVCAAPVQAAVNGVKLECSAFPHASQDAETITCAETCVWEVVEYYGNKYQEHSTVLPSEILTVLKSMSYERQLPARGLNINQMSYALRKLGFSPRVYGRSQNPGDFDSLLACYVQSGLPLILAVETVDEPGRPKVKDPIGHAMLCVGYEAQQEHMVGAVVPLTSPRKTVNDAMKNQGIALLDYDAMKRRYVFIDDNQPVYQIQLLNTPCVHYPLPEWHPCRITYFLAPLPEKVYLEASGAKAYVQSMLTEGPRPLPSGSRTWLRTYHTSSRSLKHWLATKGFSSPAIRDKLMECVMPKFVWVTELSTDQEIKDFKSSGLVILDATEPRTRGNKAHIMSCYDGDVIEGSELKRTSLHLPPFNRFENLTKYEA